MNNDKIGQIYSFVFNLGKGQKSKKLNVRQIALKAETEICLQVLLSFFNSPLNCGH